MTMVHIREAAKLTGKVRASIAKLCQKGLIDGAEKRPNPKVRRDEWWIPESALEFIRARKQYQGRPKGSTVANGAKKPTIRREW